MASHSKKLQDLASIVLARFARRFRRLAVLSSGATRTPEDVQRAIRRKWDRGQWHRWYKANRRYQRQLRAIRQTGRAVHMPHSLTREMVP